MYNVHLLRSDIICISLYILLCSYVRYIDFIDIHICHVCIGIHQKKPNMLLSQFFSFNLFKRHDDAIRLIPVWHDILVKSLDRYIPWKYNIDNLILPCTYSVISFIQNYQPITCMHFSLPGKRPYNFHATC